MNTPTNENLSTSEKFLLEESGKACDAFAQKINQELSEDFAAMRRRALDKLQDTPTQRWLDNWQSKTAWLGSAAALVGVFTFLLVVDPEHVHEIPEQGVAGLEQSKIGDMEMLLDREAWQLLQEDEEFLLWLEQELYSQG